MRFGTRYVQGQRPLPVGVTVRNGSNPTIA